MVDVVVRVCGFVLWSELVGGQARNGAEFKE